MFGWLSDSIRSDSRRSRSRMSALCACLSITLTAYYHRHVQEIEKSLLARMDGCVGVGEDEDEDEY